MESNSDVCSTPISVPPNLPDNYVVPLNIFQTWHNKTLPPKMKACVDSVMRDNPNFKHYMYDVEDCRKFIRDEYDFNVLNAYDSLIPLAYKADLWRCCILYKYGGVYLDIKFGCINGFCFESLCDDDYFVKDRSHVLGKDAVFNALIIARPKNEILYNCIRQIVKNVKNRFYGDSPLDITGPIMMIRCFSPEDKEKLNRLIYIDVEERAYYIIYGHKLILMMYPEYRNEQMMDTVAPRYAYMWDSRTVFID